jgi:hypothetical protein
MKLPKHLYRRWEWSNWGTKVYYIQDRVNNIVVCNFNSKHKAEKAYLAALKAKYKYNIEFAVGI